MTVATDSAMPESLSADKSARRLSNQPIAMAAAAHAALFIAGSIWMMTHEYITVIHRLYLAFLGSGLVAWGVLLLAGLGIMAGRQLGLLGKRAAARNAAREDQRLVGQLAAA